MLSFKKLREETIGQNFTFNTPYGRRLLTYADYTASGRSLKFIEKFLISIQREYANTHTEDDVTGRHMTAMLHKAEHLIKKSFNADQNCAIIATGTGSTGAISKMQEILGVRLPPATKFRINQIMNQSGDQNSEINNYYQKVKEQIDKWKPIVFVGPYEHHSNDIMWRESLDETVEIALNNKGYIDMKDLEAKVSDPKYEGRFKIGSFSAASNVTGIKSPVYDIARLMHKYGGIACFDFAASAPYVEINMNKDNEAYFDAVYISPHKFLGGPGSSGILVFNEMIYNQILPPTYAAGGTVDYVSPFAVDYIKDIETREKPGTPGILQTIKAALAVDVKNQVGIDKIEKKEQQFARKAFARLGKHPNIEILGPQDPEGRICIFSMNIKQSDKYLHPKFVTKLLNDLFGIQSRAGCSCAGVYGHHLLNIDKKTSEKFRKVVEKGIYGIKPGWVRVNFHYTFSEETFDFICKTLEFVADFGHLFLPQYKFHAGSGEWEHINFKDTDLDISPDISSILRMQLSDCFDEKPVNHKAEYNKYLKDAEQIKNRLILDEKYGKFDDIAAESIRWFNFINIVG